ncbi:MAG: sensor histidine kinase [Micrococcales bacterium]
MKLQTRLTITATAIITIATLGVGGVSVFGSFNREIGAIKHELATDAKAVSEAKKDALSTALLYGQQQDLTVALLDINGHFTVINEGSAVLQTTPTKRVLREAAKYPVLRTHGSRHFVLSAIPLPNDEWVVLATSYQPQLSALQQNQTWLYLSVALAVLAAAVAIAVLIRRDLRGIKNLVNQASQIADGKVAAFETLDGSYEVTELSEALGSMVGQLKAHSAEMQRFLGDASHELRTPLTVIRGYLDLYAGADLGSERGQQFVVNSVPKLQAEVLRMQSLINDLLLLAELGEPGGARNPEPVDLSTLLRDQATSLLDLQPKRPARVNVTDGIEVVADRHLISQLLNNLFGNLRRHTAEDDAFAIELTHHDGWAQLVIDDAGPGLSPEAYQRGVGFFERFDPSRSRENGGSGLGMSIMAGVVAKHGGSMRLEPSPLGGLRSVIRLPEVG